MMLTALLHDALEVASAIVGEGPGQSSPAASDRGRERVR